MDKRTRWSPEALSATVCAFAAALVVAALFNGGGVFLKRVGILEPERAEAFWAMRCGSTGTTSEPFELGRRCVNAPPEDEPAAERNRREEPYRRYLHEVRRGEVWLKVAKDVVLLVLVLFSLLLTARASAAWAGRAAWPLWGLCLAVLLAGTTALAQGRVLEAAAGARAFGFLAVALVGSWAMLGTRARRWTGALLALLVAEVALMSWEALWGLPVYGYHALQLPSRLMGTLVLPNTLGVFAVDAAAFVAAFGTAGRGRLVAWAAAVLLVAGAGSATGWFALLALAAFHAGGRLRSLVAARAVAAAALVGLLVWLPKLVDRPDVYDSITGPRGRLDQLTDVLSGPALTVAFGRGLGSGTNASLNLGGTGSQPASAPADSAITLLLRQTGLLGAGLFYAALLLAWRRDVLARPFYLAALVCSVTANLPEVYPVNVLLGLSLARSFTLAPRVGRQA